jgi:DNA-binding response OmpR family regulator
LEEIKSVLIVDDDEVLLDTFKQGLSAKGYHCETASNSTLALSLIAKNLYDILIVDIVLPDITGLELTAKAKRIKPNVAIIVITGYVNEYPYEKVMDTGVASDFIKKPFTLKELIARINFVKIQKELLDREKELQRRVKDLKEFYEIAFGREQKIKELKKEKEKLKEELEKSKES